MCKYVCVRMHIIICTNICTYVYTCVCDHTSVRYATCVRACVRTYVHTYWLCTYMCKHMSVRMHKWVCTNMCKYVCTCACFHIYLCTHVRTCRIRYMMYIFVSIFATILLQTYLDIRPVLMAAAEFTSKSTHRCILFGKNSKRPPLWYRSIPRKMSK